MTLADPVTNASLQSVPEMRFPVLVMTGDAARVQFLSNIRQVPKLPAGSSYLVPLGREKAVQATINADHPPGTEGGWVVRVRRITPGHQRIELFWMNDGYAGGVYEATETSMSPLYRKITGPGFAFIFGGIALLINTALWATILMAIRWWRERRPVAS